MIFVWFGSLNFEVRLKSLLVTEWCGGFLKSQMGNAGFGKHLPVCSHSSSKVHQYYILEPQTTIYKWLFQWDDSKSWYRKWLFHQTSIYKWYSRQFIATKPAAQKVVNRIRESDPQNGLKNTFSFFSRIYFNHKWGPRCYGIIYIYLHLLKLIFVFPVFHVRIGKLKKQTLWMLWVFRKSTISPWDGKPFLTERWMTRTRRRQAFTSNFVRSCREAAS